jgi:hypothetical protein
MYLIKTKGNDKIPDFVQLRDEQLILVNHCRFSNFEKNEILCRLTKEQSRYIFNELPYGLIYKLNIL